MKIQTQRTLEIQLQAIQAIAKNTLYGQNDQFIFYAKNH